MFKRNFFVEWFRSQGRHFPWREEGTTPFAFLVTEMLLRQTRAPNVARIWKSFLNDYPTAGLLAAANKQELALRLKPLGFGEQKADALIAASTWLIEHHGGQVPNTLDELLRIPHVGNYAARALLCFTFGKRVEIVDTNVLRLFSRYFGIDLKPDIRRAPVAWEIARQILPRDRKRAQQHNYGILDFTADICKSGRPKCEVCPLSSTCVFGQLTLATRK
jgi:A/G-specific adenine glycosylase